MGRVRKGRPREGTAAAQRLRVIEALGLANLGAVDLMKVRTKEDADREIARFQRSNNGATECLAGQGVKIHYARDQRRTLCGFKISVLFTKREPNRAAPQMEHCAMCLHIHEKENA